MAVKKHDILIIFTKNPVKGKVKKRLAKDLGDEQALNIYNTLINHIKEITKSLPCTKVVYYSELIERRDIWKDTIYQKAKQKGEGLGERMANAFRDAFNNDFNKVVLIGTDCYQLTTEIIDQAYGQLEENDVVLGPAKDGGYYLVGLKSLFDELFENKAWGTDSVLESTINDIKKTNKHYTLLPQLIDIDNAKDLDDNPLLKEQVRQ